MDLTEKQQVERQCFNVLVKEKWQNKSLWVDKDYPPFSFYSADLLEGAKKYLGNVSGKKILEIGCGNGELSVWLAKNGAQVVGVDISDESIKIAQKRSIINNTSQPTSFYACPAEQIPFPDKFFDLVFINVSLHHLEVDVALREFKRVLKTPGRLVAIEPLAISQFIQNLRTSKFFTKLYPIRQETPTERILIKADLEIIRTYFFNLSVTPFRLFSPFIYKLKPLFNFLANLFIKDEIDFEKRKQKMNRILQQGDEYLLRRLPFLKCFSRYVVLVCEKND